MKRTLIAMGLMLALASTASHAYQGGYETVSSHGTVYRVVDADTFVVNLHDRDSYLDLVAAANGDPEREQYFNNRYQSIRIRLAGANTAESDHNDPSLNTLEGKAISRQMTGLLEKRETQVHCFDWGDHGRAICSLSFDNGVDVGEWLISEGHSPYVTNWGRHPYYDERYRAAEEYARSQ